jgi:glycosyltransferase involved in cell wall biosynthesis
MNALSILHVVNSLETGGLERFVVDLAAAQHAAGHRVHVCALHGSGPLEAELRSFSIQVSHVGKGQGVDVPALVKLRRTLAEAGRGVVHTHNALAHYYSCLASIALRRIGPIVNTRHDMGGDFSKDLAERLYRLAMLRTAHVVSVSKASADVLLAEKVVAEERLSVIPNGIPAKPDKRDNSVQRPRARSLLNVGDSTVVFGAVGRLAPVKNHKGLLEAFSTLARAREGVRLVIVGDGPLRDELEAQRERLACADCVTMLGARSDVRELLPGLDVFLQPSFSESYSIALVEAAAAGLPMIATDVGGNAEIVQDRWTGRIVPTGDLDALCSAMNEMAECPQTRAEYGRRAEEWFDKHARIEASASAYEALYRRVLA